MGMDVFGRGSTSSPQGKYFRANIWSWRPIHALIVELCSDLFDDETLARLGYNVGAGPDNAKVCREMATRFERWLEHHASGHEVDLGLRVDSAGQLLTPETVAANPTLETRSAYRVDDEHLKEWVEFLRHCDGFEVW